MIKNAKKNSPAKKVALTGILAALALTLSFLESLLPPVAFLPPGAKLGLSNMIVMFSVLTASLPQALCIVLLKSLYVLISRGFSSFLISFCGGLLSCIVMFLLTRKPFERLGLIGVSVLSAVAHNIGQLSAASVLTGTVLVAYLPMLLLFGVFFGVVTGVVLRVVMPVLMKIQTGS